MIQHDVILLHFASQQIVAETQFFQFLKLSELPREALKFQQQIHFLFLSIQQPGYCHFLLYKDDLGLLSYHQQEDQMMTSRDDDEELIFDLEL